MPRKYPRITLACLTGVAFLMLVATQAPSARAEWSGPCLPGGDGPTCHFWKGKVTFIDDGDTIDVRMRTSTGKRKTVRVRIVGIQAMELSAYSSNPSKRRGACHAVRATARLEGLVKRAGWRVRLAAQDPSSSSEGRPRRSVAVKSNGRWRDLGSVLVAEGHALWLPHPVEYAWNATYARLAQGAAAAHRHLWSTATCGVGPSDGAPLRLTVEPDAKGNDFENVNGERVTIENLDTVPVPLDGWWLRDSSPRRFEFPAWATIPPGGEITIKAGDGDQTEDTLYWGLEEPVFENVTKGRGLGDGAYLFDPQGDLRAWMMYPCYVGCAG
jgi:micrococcal nuclease